MISFAKKVKKELCNLNGKLKSCCGYSLIYGILFSAKKNEEKVSLKILNNDVGNFFVDLCKIMSVKKEFQFRYINNRVEILSDFLRFSSYDEISRKILRCGKCKEFFLRGVFLANGSISDPEKSYRLELVFDNENKSLEIKEMLENIGIISLMTERNKKCVLYLRKSEAIEDFFANIGATSLAFDIMNSKINKELINNANRITNCDSANINKALKASNKYIAVINDLIETENINLLPEHLREMALKRIEHQELGFADLGRQFSPSISKSGVYHRLEKIIKFYEEIKNKN